MTYSEIAFVWHQYHEHARCNSWARSVSCIRQRSQQVNWYILIILVFAEELCEIIMLSVKHTFLPIYGAFIMLYSEIAGTHCEKLWHLYERKTRTCEIGAQIIAAFVSKTQNILLGVAL